jgi:hypothetical protein
MSSRILFIWLSGILLLVFWTNEHAFRYAIRTKHKATILHAILWALAAWVCWMYVFLRESLTQEPVPPLYRYMALGLTGCASIAVLGARRPGVGAWNFVVLGLLIVMIFLWLEGQWAADDVILSRVRTVFLASTIAIGVLNYLPTRLAPAAILLGCICAFELLLMAGAMVARREAQLLAGFGLASIPWVAYIRMRWRPPSASEFDQTWLPFRDCFGLVWAQRVREQFNQSAKHSHWPVILRWQGLRAIPGETPPSYEDRQEMLANLRALMKRFEAPERNNHG